MDFFVDSQGLDEDKPADIIKLDSNVPCKDETDVASALVQKLIENAKKCKADGNKKSNSRLGYTPSSTKNSDPMDWQKIKYESTKSKVDFFQKDTTELDKILKKSAVLKPGFEKLRTVPSHQRSLRQKQKIAKKERERTKGKDWFNISAPEMTEEVKHDLEILQMRSVLDPKHFYKKNDMKVLPKHFQIGKVMDSPLDFYSNRCTKKERKRTLVDELLADAEFNKYNKKKYKEIIAEKSKTDYKLYMKSKKQQRKNKKSKS